MVSFGPGNRLPFSLYPKGTVWVGRTESSISISMNQGISESNILSERPKSLENENKSSLGNIDSFNEILVLKWSYFQEVSLDEDER